MSTAIFFRTLIVALAITWLPLASPASNKRATSLISNKITWQDRKDKKQERGKENKKQEVKEVPQSRKQGKPEEVKPDKKEKPKDKKRDN
ncbi:hypothetical protein [Pedobacter heparinus]|uniref:hypothetical protein n=1 Tax=Pedobacter heparinus TaxID=984 RepID=UPI00292E9900|nr:hypothetical protein [Pedobacter heparinus]